MTSRGQLEQEHFDRIALRYAQASKSWASLSGQLVERIAPLVRGKTVLDVGNGGFFAYDPASASTVTGLDISPAMLERIDQQVAQREGRRPPLLPQGPPRSGDPW